ncbi:hypothetical protein ODE01S_04300 [Oceanithermus desulfurans NBRC 100063]|uniref:Uncharacterized protein n=1 Tax=Oceanithermus desulfurans NBRC 100063 TaxID=1227550 RepID=A0A511RJK5_9DEIN|nr:hypothetical protein ODE01S_04300 [Oceanithermus desulfurans NBRC 100063]
MGGHEKAPRPCADEEDSPRYHRASGGGLRPPARGSWFVVGGKTTNYKPQATYRISRSLSRCIGRTRRGLLSLAAVLPAAPRATFGGAAAGPFQPWGPSLGPRGPPTPPEQALIRV